MFYSKRHITFLFMAIAALFFFSCKKETTTTAPGQIEWIRVLGDTISTSTDDDLQLGLNGKVVCDHDGNSYCYYYKKVKGQTEWIKCDGNGNVLEKHNIDQFAATDMVLLNDGSVVFSGFDPHHNYAYNILYKFNSDGTIQTIQTPPRIYEMTPDGYTVNSSMGVKPDNTIFVTTVTHFIYSNGLPASYMGSFIFINAAFQVVNERAIVFSLYSPELLSQNSVVPTTGNKCLFEFEETMDQQYHDSIYNGFKTGVYNADDTSLTILQHTTGYNVISHYNHKGAFYNYCNGLIDDGNGSYIFAISAPQYFDFVGSTFSNAFIRLNENGIVTDTIPFSMPPDFRLFSVIKNQDQFLASAFRNGVVDGSGDYSSLHTLFLIGNSSWQQTNSFSLQNFYSDFFPSVAAAGTGEYILYGKIQTFNGPSNQLVLVKYKVN